MTFRGIRGCWNLSEGSRGVKMIGWYRFEPVAQLQLGCFCPSRSDRWQHPGMNYKLSLAGAAFSHLYFYSVPQRGLVCRLLPVPSG